eukprot:SAG25_NODE_8139_length_437_cov_1.076923_1_plen_40_part_10
MHSGTTRDIIKKRVGKRALWCGRAKAVSLGAVVIAPAAC